MVRIRRIAAADIASNPIRIPTLPESNFNASTFFSFTSRRSIDTSPLEERQSIRMDGQSSGLFDLHHKHGQPQFLSGCYDP